MACSLVSGSVMEHSELEIYTPTPVVSDFCNAVQQIAVGGLLMTSGKAGLQSTWIS